MTYEGDILTQVEMDFPHSQTHNIMFHGNYE